MDEREWLTARFEQYRAHLRGVAYRMLGSMSEADDALQEAWLRIRDQDPASVEDLQAWLTTVVGRFASICFAPGAYDTSSPGKSTCPTLSWCLNVRPTPKSRH
jgi:hypothetical protein